MAKRKPKAEGGADAGNQVRTTMFFDKPLAANLRYWSRRAGRSQSEITRVALRKYLREDCKLDRGRGPIVQLQPTYQ